MNYDVRETADPVSSPIPASPPPLTHIEVHGIDYIPSQERHGRPFELFWVWMGVERQLPVVRLRRPAHPHRPHRVGGHHRHASSATCGGSPSAGSPSAARPRERRASPSCGRCSGSAATGSSVRARDWSSGCSTRSSTSRSQRFATLAAARRAGNARAGRDTSGSCSLLSRALSFVLSVYGHDAIVTASPYFSAALAVAFVVLAVFVFQAADYALRARSSLKEGERWPTLLLGYAIVASGPLSWGTGADYSRYLPANSLEVRRGVVDRARRASSRPSSSA